MLINKKSLHFEYSLAFNYYIASSYHTAFIANLLTNYFSNFPNNLPNDIVKMFKIADDYANKVHEVMKKQRKDVFLQYNSKEEAAIAMDNQYPEEINGLPKHITDLGELLYLEKTTPQALTGISNNIDYLDFVWYIQAEKIVLSHAYLEAFLTKTIDIVCKSDHSVIEKFLNVQIKEEEYQSKGAYFKSETRLKISATLEGKRPTLN